MVLVAALRSRAKWRCTGYDVQAVYEGINNWNASVVFPKDAPFQHRLLSSRFRMHEPNAPTPAPPFAAPHPAFPEGFASAACTTVRI